MYNFAVFFDVIGFDGNNALFAAAAQPMSGENDSIPFHSFAHKTTHRSVTVLNSVHGTTLSSGHPVRVCVCLQWVCMAVTFCV